MACPATRPLGCGVGVDQARLALMGALDNEGARRIAEQVVADGEAGRWDYDQPSYLDALDKFTPVRASRPSRLCRRARTHTTTAHPITNNPIVTGTTVFSPSVRATASSMSASTWATTPETVLANRTPEGPLSRSQREPSGSSARRLDVGRALWRWALHIAPDVQGNAQCRCIARRRRAQIIPSAHCPYRRMCG